ncbi:MAG: hypothetical protein CMH57_06030 [Myxococcales bacterium]|nr:hypothetical protein [Myxococcales bacterium]
MYVNHTDLAEGVAFSPGTCPDGAALSTGCTGGNTSNNPAECPEAPMPGAGDLVLNEVHADPDADNGDANGDGVVSTSDDEFVEIVNVSGQTLRVAGLELYKNGADSPGATIATSCLGPNQAIVLFRGLADGASPPDLGSDVMVEIQLDSLNNDGATLTLQTPDGGVIFDVDYGGAGNDQSVALSPQLDASGDYVDHATLTEDGALFNPGTCPDGQPFSSGCPGGGAMGDCPDAAAPTAASLIVNEVLTAVPTGDEGDANMDGNRDSSDDEFLEFVNIGAETLNISGLVILKGDSEEAVVATECLAPGETLVLFGGGVAPDLGPGIKAEIASGSFGFTNSGTNVTVRSSAGVEIFNEELPGASGASFTRQTQLDPNAPMVPHTDVSAALYSVGACANGSALASGCPGGPGDGGGMDGGMDTGDMMDGGMDTGGMMDAPPSACDMAPMAAAGDLIINEIHADPDADNGDANGDGVVSTSDDEFVEIVNVSGGLVRVAGVELFRETTSERREATLTTSCLGPGEALVIFSGLEDGAQPPDLGAGVYVEIDAIGLNNSDMTLRLKDPDGAIIFEIAYGDAGNNQSLNLSPELDSGGTLVEHTTLAGEGVLFSPGTCANGASLSTGCN